MGDHPSTRKRMGNELTDNIFEPPLKNVNSMNTTTFSVSDSFIVLFVY
jgi:hypothetical protein